jgi:hypothetical protein
MSISSSISKPIPGRIPLLLASLGLLFAADAGQAQDAALPKAAEVQQKLEQWVQAKQLISRESSDWEEGKATMLQLKEARKLEIAQLQEFAEAANQRIAEIEEKRALFQADEKDLKTWRSSLEGHIAAQETQLAKLIPRFPPPLREKVEESLLRLESPDPQSPLQNRTRDILLVLQAYLDFQNTLTLDSEVREIDGKKHQVDILYLGMSQAWYVDSSGSYSGYGRPGAAGWVWTDEPAIAERVRSAIEIQRRRESPAYVELPIGTKSQAEGGSTK